MKKSICLILISCLILFGSMDTLIQPRPYATNPQDAETGFAYADNNAEEEEGNQDKAPEKEVKKDYIRWVDFRASYEILSRAMEYDIATYSSGIHMDMCEMLAYVALKNGNRFENYKSDFKQLNNFVAMRRTGKSALEITANNKYYLYYLECFRAVFAQFIGSYVDAEDNMRYGLKAFFPLARGYWYSHSDDFGNSRSYGFKRKHLGHDLFGSVGTPIIAVEGGTVAELGWNRYGGWRIGIRSDDTLRYYYYAHLRKDRPYYSGLKAGDRVNAGQVIGYLGVTGYSYKENKNMDTKPHLHFGIQLIFDESQADGAEIWIDVYNICRLLSVNRARVAKNVETGDYFSIYNF